VDSSVSVVVFRFNEEFPRLPDIRRVFETQMTCDPAAASAQTQRGMNSSGSSWTSSSSSSSLQHLDAALFYSSSAQSDYAIDLSASTASSSSLSSSSSAVHRYDSQYNVDASAAATAAAQPPFSNYPVLTLSDVTDGVDVNLLRAVFLLSDLVVFVYRLTVTYVTVRAIRRRSAAGRSRCGESHHRQLLMMGDGGGADHSTLRSSSSRTALTSALTSASVVGRAVADTANIYTDPQTLLVDSCPARTILSSDCSSSSSTRRAPCTGDVKHPQSGQSAACHLIACVV